MNDGIGDDAESDPAPDAVRSFVERSAQPVAAFENADTTFTAGAPFLKLFEPTLLLPLFACSAFGVVAGNRDLANSHLLGFGFVRGREESGICGHELRYTSELFDVFLQTSYQLGSVSRPLLAHLVMRDDLVLGLLNQDQFAELIGLMRLALADHLGVRLEDAEQLPLGPGIAA